MSNKNKYRALCEVEKSIPLFSKAWWLDMVCGEDGWDVVVYEKCGEILASLPFYIKRKYGLTILSQPKFTQTLGVWYKATSTKYAKRLGQEKEIIRFLVDSLPKHHVFYQSFDYSFSNWLPFYYLGFEQTSKYTYVIDDLSNIDDVWRQTNANIKTDVRKAEKKLKVVNEVSCNKIYDILQKTYRRQGAKSPISYVELNRVITETTMRNAGKVFAAVDDFGKVHSVLLLVWDENSSYYLIGGGDPELRNSGAASLCIWEAIKFSSTVTRKFNFEGSMVEGIERFFRGFGAKQKQYFRIMRFNSVFLSLFYHIKKYKTGKI